MNESVDSAVQTRGEPLARFACARWEGGRRPYVAAQKDEIALRNVAQNSILRRSRTPEALLTLSRTERSRSSHAHQGGGIVAAASRSREEYEQCATGAVDCLAPNRLSTTGGLDGSTRRSVRNWGSFGEVER